jgi:hypothetical protein
MNDNKLVPAIAAGFAAAVLTTIPGLRSTACCLIIPLASVFAIFLYRKMNNNTEKIKPGIGLLFGLMTGLAAAIFATGFDVVITYLTKTNELVENLPNASAAMEELNFGAMGEQMLELMKIMAKDIKETGFSATYTMGIFFTNILTYIIFGMIGGLIGSLIMNRKSS